MPAHGLDQRTVRDPSRAVHSHPPVPTGTPSRPRVAGPFLWLGDEKLTVKAVTYGTFGADERGDLFPPRKTVRDDFVSMRESGINTVRTYTAPPPWFLEEARAAGLWVLVGIFWESRNCNLEQPQAMRDARAAVDQALRNCAEHRDVVLAYVIGNEIPALVARFHGSRVVERFLRNLRDRIKHDDPQALVSYGNFPPTEFLQLDFLDFHTFNIYLLEPKKLASYLDRVMILTKGKPLLLGEIGDDSIRRGPQEQAALLDWSIPLALDKGVVGLCVFSWTDEWVVAGHRVDDWAFGLVDAERQPKPALAVVKQRFGEDPIMREGAVWPRVSVVVCNFNGGATLDETLRSLIVLDYPDYEVIYVDDGSTDDSLEIARRYENRIRIIAQPNCGLGVARNVGMEAATGEIIAYTDSDAYADGDWLRYIVLSMQSGEFVAAGGPNLTPSSDGFDAQCIATCPGNPTYVLRDNVDAEHIAGVNMAFRRDVLRGIGGFGPEHRKAGDDVDVCWRLLDAGMKIAFSPAAIVWHHRRPSMWRYLKQQYGYGEAENQLERKHRERFNLLGCIRWEGRVYQAPKRVTGLFRPFIYHGRFGTGMFQSLYQHEPTFWFIGPSTVQWYGVWLLLFALAPLSLWPAAIGAVMFLMSVSHATSEGFRTTLGIELDRSQTARKIWIVSLLHFLHPPVRWWGRTRPRLARMRRKTRIPLRAFAAEFLHLFPRRKQTRSYWGACAQGREALIERVRQVLKADGVGASLGLDWDNFDILVDGSLVAEGRIYSSTSYYDQAISWGFRNRTPRQTLWAGVAVAIFAVGMVLRYSPWFALVLLIPVGTIWSVFGKRARLRSIAWNAIDRVMGEVGSVRFEADDPRGERQV